MAESTKRLRILIASLEEQGCTVKDTKKGWWVGFPDGTSMTVHLTQSDWRADKNTRARVLRAGLVWPFDQK